MKPFRLLTSSNIIFTHMAICLLFIVTVNGSYLQRTVIASASIQQSRQQRRWTNPSRPVAMASSIRRRRDSDSTRDVEVVLIARRSKKSTEQKEENAEVPVDGDLQNYSYKDLSLLGKIFAGTVEVSFIAFFDYILGFCGGYVLGSVWGLPGLVFKKGDPASSDLIHTITRRFAEMNQRSFRWATSWGGVNAVVGGFGTTARILRGGVEDEWTHVLSSMAMGAFFCRKDGYFAMLKGALFYGTLVKIFSSTKPKAELGFEDQTAVDL